MFVRQSDSDVELLDLAVKASMKPLPAPREALSKTCKGPAAATGSSNERYVEIPSRGRVRISPNTHKTYLQCYDPDSGSWKLVVNVEIRGLPTEIHQSIGWVLFELLKKKPDIKDSDLKMERDRLVKDWKVEQGASDVDNHGDDDGDPEEEEEGEEGYEEAESEEPERDEEEEDEESEPGESEDL